MSDAQTDTEPERSTPTDRGALNTDMMQWLSAIVALVGLYIAVSPFLFEATQAATWNDLLVGIAIFLLAGYNFLRLARDHLANVGVASLAALLGLWALISPFVIEMGSNELATGTALSGLIVAALSAYNAYANRRAAAPDRAAART